MRAEIDIKSRLGELVDELVSAGLPLSQAREAFERQYVLASLRKHEGSLNRAAQELGVHRNTLRNKVVSLRISSAEYGSRRRAKKPRGARPS